MTWITKKSTSGKRGYHWFPYKKYLTQAMSLVLGIIPIINNFHNSHTFKKGVSVKRM